ncbi:MAG: 5-formyltetrahydrofolate cyclo-ligase [Sulfuricurvum sp.]|uniref:5-formyltetrahydrofolate cyclo-ligase n=1 Tax=Sulfuricurvum sp. TaxID=2025608 RepID=UPI002635CFA4|nr:5-formyltetrahydrofolate cyclo-ligase [Sulfuricurvum sp.]MDD2830090.1 5-formyltetrahydrofolate cyclo-ligase [Sulfuricurvum sp.]MDD4949925.1 5-formyltetrahydrofolate cyclo-ligase [Sulfuricurvum sp.]
MTKSDFRSECLKRHKSLSPHTKKYRDFRVNHHLMNILRHHKGKRILFYWPFGFEADIRRTIFALRAKKTIYLPFMDDISFKMVPLRLPLEHKAFGIYEPRNSCLNIKLIDIAIVPVVGVDGSGARIGFGKGMYDRFFPTLKAKPLTIFVQSHYCYTPKLLCDDYDVRGDILITPEGIRSLKDSNVRRTTRQWQFRHGRCSRRIFNC